MVDDYFEKSDFKEVGYSAEVPETYMPEVHVQNRDFTFKAPPPPPPSQSTDDN